MMDVLERTQSSPTAERKRTFSGIFLPRGATSNAEIFFVLNLFHNTWNISLINLLENKVKVKSTYVALALTDQMDTTSTVQTSIGYNLTALHINKKIFMYKAL